jgi:hypothetical protein
MKKIILLVTISFIFFAGCQSSNQNITSNKISVEGGGKFPKYLVGTWKSDRNVWQIEFGKKGEIVSLVYIFWNEKIYLNQGYIYDEGKYEKDAFAYFLLGPCNGTYNPISRKLKVNLNMEEYTISMSAGTIRGHSEDYMEGIVSKGGLTWDAEWREYGYMEKAAPPDVNYINENPEKIIFSKQK